MPKTPPHAQLLCLALAACTHTGLQPVGEETAADLDHLVDVRGDFCAQPDATVSFPVKVLFLLDQSTSLQCTDSRNRRFEALRSLTSELTDQPDTQIGFIGFSSWARVQPFTRDRSAFGTMLDPAGGLGPATDYQGTLAQAIRLLEEDMVSVGAGERARTRYVVVFISDGVPSPRCNEGCEDTISACSNGIDDDGDTLIDEDDPDCFDITNNDLHPDNLYGICNTTAPIPEGEYVDFSGRCPAYNQPEQILGRINDMLALRDVYGVGAITMHSVLFFSPQSVVDGVCGGDAARDFGFEETRARGLLRAMAAQGQGAYRDANLATDDDSFLRFDFRSLETAQALQSFSARNTNARVLAGELMIDTDADGIPDAIETTYGGDPRAVDTDGDDWSDAFERALASEGFDPIDPSRPAVRCLDATDLDGDGLRDCEEDYLGTDARNPDTDGDRILDGVELVMGTDPLAADQDDDLDFDGISNGDEIRGGSDPMRPDEDFYRRTRMQYGLSDLGRLEVTDADGRTAERRCHRYEVRRVPLVVTPIADARGRNRIYLYAQEQPSMLGGAEATTSVACFEALYLGGRVKHPESGRIDVTVEQWTSLREALEDAFTALEGCAWLGEGARRDDVRDVIESCLPDPVPVGNFAFANAALRELLARYFDGNGGVRLPDHPAALFQPVEVFDPERHCHRPWELERLLSLLDVLGSTCGTCEDDPDASPCCGAER